MQIISKLICFTKIQATLSGIILKESVITEATITAI